MRQHRHAVASHGQVSRGLITVSRQVVLSTRLLLDRSATTMKGQYQTLHDQTAKLAEIERRLRE